MHKRPERRAVLFRAKSKDAGNEAGAAPFDYSLQKHAGLRSGIMRKRTPTKERGVRSLLTSARRQESSDSIFFLGCYQ